MAEIEIFVGPNCTYCEAAKNILRGNGLSFIERTVAEPEHLSELQLRLPRNTAIPQIFVDGEHIGSTEDLEARARDGRTPFRSAA